MGAMTILVRGVGDVGSAVAHQLFQAGYAVALHDTAQPATTRRGMAFADAIFDGRADLHGVTAVRLDDPAALAEMLTARRAIPVVVAPLGDVLAVLAPDVLVDARMRKRVHPETQRGLAPLTIGLGPNFRAVETTDLAVETTWESAGTVVAAGATRPLAGEPREIAGHGRDRYVYVPVAGVFRTGYQIGDDVRAGDSAGALHFYRRAAGAVL